MARKRDWRGLAKGILKSELKRRNMSYRDLVERLRVIGVHETERNLSNKVSRGTFAASFFLQCLSAIGVKSLHLDEL
jgi:hypothetical protein